MYSMRVIIHVDVHVKIATEIVVDAEKVKLSVFLLVDARTGIQPVKFCTKTRC